MSLFNKIKTGNVFFDTVPINVNYDAIIMGNLLIGDTQNFYPTELYSNVTLYKKLTTDPNTPVYLNANNSINFKKTNFTNSSFSVGIDLNISGNAIINSGNPVIVNIDANGNNWNSFNQMVNVDYINGNNMLLNKGGLLSNYGTLSANTFHTNGNILFGSGTASFNNNPVKFKKNAIFNNPDALQIADISFNGNATFNNNITGTDVFANKNLTVSGSFSTGIAEGPSTNNITGNVLFKGNLIVSPDMDVSFNNLSIVNGKKIYIIDDNAINRDILREFILIGERIVSLESNQ
jgi:hypothetical protein